jgi:O-antigen ligase
MMMALALGSTVAAVSSAFTGFDRQGRLSMEGTSLDDPNTLGMTFLLGLPLWMSVISDRSRNPFSRMVVVLFTVPILVALPLTGSRGTLVAALICVINLFRRFSIGGKMGLVVLVGLVVTLSVTYLADDLMSRYMTVADPNRLENTAESESRVYLLKQGFILLAQRPITGVGLGMFAVAENDLAIEQGFSRGTWHTCHNMFMEVASEGGIPGFIVYLFILWTVWKTLTRIEKLSPDEHPLAAQVGRQAFWMKITFLVFCACGLFLSTGLTNTFVTFVALPIAFGRIVRSEVNEFASEREAAEGESEQEAAAERVPKPLRPMEPVRGLRGSA